jgi:hypothetical protein
MELNNTREFLLRALDELLELQGGDKDGEPVPPATATPAAAAAAAGGAGAGTPNAPPGGLAVRQRS